MRGTVRSRHTSPPSPLFQIARAADDALVVHRRRVELRPAWAPLPTTPRPYHPPLARPVLLFTILCSRGQRRARLAVATGAARTARRDPLCRGAPVRDGRRVPRVTRPATPAGRWRQPPVTAAPSSSRRVQSARAAPCVSTQRGDAAATAVDRRRLVKSRRGTAAAGRPSLPFQSRPLSPRAPSPPHGDAAAAATAAAAAAGAASRRRARSTRCRLAFGLREGGGGWEGRGGRIHRRGEDGVVAPPSRERRRWRTCVWVSQVCK